MATPESKVKAKVREVLRDLDLYHFMPATHGYGSSGVPDIVACGNGKFFGIECKANGGKPTELQKKNLADIVERGGYSFVVDETSIGVLQMIMKELMSPNFVYPPTVYDLCRESPTAATARGQNPRTALPGG